MGMGFLSGDAVLTGAAFVEGRLLVPSSQRDVRPATGRANLFLVQWHQTVDACNLRRKKARAKYDLHTFSMPIRSRR